MAELASALAARSLKLQDSALATQCIGIMTELGISQEDFLDELDAISASSNGASIGRSQLDTARKSLEKRVQRVARFSATPVTKFDKTNAHMLPGYMAESSTRPPASSSTPSMPTPAAKRATAGGAASASSGGARPAQTSPVFSSTSKAPGSSAAKPLPAVVYADRTNAGEVVDVYTPSSRTLPAPDVCGPLLRPSMEAIRAAGGEFSAGLSRFTKAPGRLLDTALTMASPLPLTCGGVDAYAAFMGLRLVHPLALHGMPAEAAPPAQASSPIASSPASSSPTADAPPSAEEAMDVDPSPSAGSSLLRSTLPLCLPVDRNAHDAFRWMFITKERRVENLDGRISEMEDAIGAVHDVAQDIVPLGSTSQEPVTYVGRVVVDGEGRINPSSVLLEGSTFNTVAGLPGNRIHVDLTDIPSFSLFPGRSSA